MSQQATLGKRQHEESSINDSKMQKRSRSGNPSPSTGSNLSRPMRILCPASRLESIIGEDGRTISQIHKETRVRLHVEDPFPGCDERVITIGGLDLSGSKASYIQKALLLLFDRMVEASSHVVRLLVHSTQAGLPPSTIKRISSESGAQILILVDDQLPSCASPSDEVVQISGEADAVRRALRSDSLRLLQGSFPARESGGGCPPPYASRFHGDGGRDSLPYFTLSYRMLCSEEKVGGVMGKRGNRIQRLQDETGCKIEALDGGKGDNREERIFVISGPAHPNEGMSAPQDAVVRLQSRIFRSHPVSTERTLTSKLLVSAHQVGCLLGRSGSVMAEMKRDTGAHIRILSKNRVPKHASEDDEVVQINGTSKAIREALIHITSRLRNHFFRDALRHYVPPPPTRPDSTEQAPPPLPPQEAARPMGSLHGDQSAPSRQTGGNQPAATTRSRKAEVAVPCSIVPALEGGCLARIQEFSDAATIMIMDREPGANERMVVIKGTPQQTITARSLVRAFVIGEKEARSL